MGFWVIVNVRKGKLGHLHNVDVHVIHTGILQIKNSLSSL